MKEVFFLLFLAICGNIYGDTAAAPPNRSARTCDGYAGIFLTGEFIYWKARQEELNTIGTFAFEQNGVERFVDVKSKEIDFKYSPGFKLGLGGNLPFDGWDLYVNWTHLRNNPVTTFRSSTHNLIDIERLGDGGAPFVTNHAKVSYDLILNIIDFDWGRRCFVSDTWSVRPSFGGKTFWIHQQIRYSYENVQTIPLPNIGAITGFPEFLNAINNSSSNSCVISRLKILSLCTSSLFFLCSCHIVIVINVAKRYHGLLYLLIEGDISQNMSLNAACISGSVVIT